MLYGGVCAFLEEGGILGLELLLSPPIRAPPPTLRERGDSSKTL